MSYSDNEYIKLNRKIKNWEWFTDVNTTYFFIYCLLTANWKDDSFHGVEIKRGQFIRTLDNISRETGLSIQNIRTAIKHLISTQELTQNQHGKYRIFTVVKYDYYQLPNTKPNNELTENQHESNTKVTQSKEDKKIRSKEVNKNNKPPISPFDELDKTDLSETIKSCLREWFEYKKQKKDKVYPTQIGFNKFIKEVKQAIEGHGEEKVIKQFDYAMSRGWSGAYLDKIQGEQKQSGNTGFSAAEFLKRYEE